MKKVVNCLYVHKSNIDELGKEFVEIVRSRENLVEGFEYDIIKRVR